MAGPLSTGSFANRFGGNKKQRSSTDSITLAAFSSFPLLASIFGYLTFAQVLRQTTLISRISRNTGVYCRVLHDFDRVRSDANHTHRKAQHHANVMEPAIEAWVGRCIIVYGLWFWLSSTLDLLSLKERYYPHFSSVL